MPDVILNATRRAVLGKQVRSLRRQGIVPANVYGRGIESVPVQFDLSDLRDILMQAGSTTVVDLHISSAEGQDDGHSHPVLVERVQRRAANGAILHVDFRQVELDRPVKASIPIVLTGEAPAAEAGAVVVQALDTMDVEALPRSLPQQIEVDISVLVDTTSQIAVGDLTLPEGVTPQPDAATIVVSVVASRVQEDVAAEDAVTAVAAAEAAESQAAASGEAAADEGQGEGATSAESGNDSGS